MQVRQTSFVRAAGALLFLSLLFCLPADAQAAIYINSSTITLAWTSSPEPDVQGYEAFRASSFGGEYLKAHEGIITGSSWTDANVIEGEPYHYKLRAIDTCGNQSSLSGATDAIIIDLTTPTIAASPPGGTYSDAINVSLISSEPATMYFTLDGTAPISNFQIYAGPVSINVDGTLRYYATDRAKNQSPVMTSQYTIVGSSDIVNIISGPDGTPNPVASGDLVQCTVLGEDSLGHSLSYEWRASDGTFSDTTNRNSVWRAPANTSGTMQNYEISVFITCSEGRWIGASYIQGVLPSTNEPPVSMAGDDRLVSAFTQVTLDGCGSHDPDGGPLPLSYSWKQTGGETVNLSGQDTCNPTFTPPGINDTLTFDLTVSDGEQSATDTVVITVDAQPPQLLIEDLAPYPDQGLDNNLGASSVGCIRVRVLDDTGININPTACETSIDVYAVANSGARLEQIDGIMMFEETEPGLVWMMFVPDYQTTYRSGLPYGLTVETTIKACDLAGNSMEPYRYYFKVEETAPTLPAQTRTEDPHPSLAGDTLSVTLAEGAMAGSRMEYLDDVPVEPFFGSVDELQSLPQGRPHTIALNLQPTLVFPTPVKIFIEMPGEKSLKKFKVYHYDPNPAFEWQRAAVGDGWLEYRADHDNDSPPTIELWVKHFTGIGLVDESSGDGGGGSVDTGGSSSSGSGCFIATAAYGSYNADNVLIFREFRDKYLLTNAPGRLFVKTYYCLSPPLADFIASHEHLRAMVRVWLSPLAAASEFALASPQKAKTICYMACMLLTTLLLLITTHRGKTRKHSRARKISLPT